MKHLNNLFVINANNLKLGIRFLPHYCIDFGVSGYSGRFLTGSSGLHLMFYCV